MDIDPLDLIEPDEAEKKTGLARQANKKSQLNTAVAISVALLATFIGVCKIKDDNIVQGMQQAQANRIDDWALYQARNLRSEIAKSTVTQLQLQAASQTGENRSAYDRQIQAYQGLAAKEDQKKLG